MKKNLRRQKRILYIPQAYSLCGVNDFRGGLQHHQRENYICLPVKHTWLHSAVTCHLHAIHINRQKMQGSIQFFRQIRASWAPTQILHQWQGLAHWNIRYWRRRCICEDRQHELKVCPICSDFTAYKFHRLLFLNSNGISSDIPALGEAAAQSTHKTILSLRMHSVNYNLSDSWGSIIPLCSYLRPDIVSGMFNHLVFECATEISTDFHNHRCIILRINYAKWWNW